MRVKEKNQVEELLNRLGLEVLNSGASSGPGGWSGVEGREMLESVSPVNGKVIAKVALCNPGDYERILDESRSGFTAWRAIPGPRRGEIVREIGNQLRFHKEDLGRLISLEVGKIISEGEGEIQEMIDIADFALGLSRQLYGLTIQSEREHHRLYEQWLPLGAVGIITSFNFPAAVYSWNAFIAGVCGDVSIWKPSSSAPLCAVAVQKIVEKALEKFSVPRGVFNLLIGRGSVVGESLLSDSRVPLVSFTGSTSMGSHVSEMVHARFGRTILELGGNNAAVVMADADFRIAKKAVLFGAVGTAGQRCTSTRRLLVHEKIYDSFVSELVKLYRQIQVGNPLEPGILCGPLVDADAVRDYESAILAIRAEGGRILTGGRTIPGDGFYVEPTIAETHPDMKIVQKETFAPILHVMKVRSIEEAIAINNGVPQGLSSSIFTNNLKEAEKFLAASGSDCGLANVNTSTSGAEIGGAFGGEKETGGGRESGSDAWKAYMRRQTVTINYGDDLPLAQGLSFNLDFSH